MCIRLGSLQKLLILGSSKAPKITHLGQEPVTAPKHPAFHNLDSKNLRLTTGTPKDNTTIERQGQVVGLTVVDAMVVVTDLLVFAAGLSGVTGLGATRLGLGTAGLIG